MDKTFWDNIESDMLQVEVDPFSLSAIQYDLSVYSTHTIDWATTFFIRYAQLNMWEMFDHIGFDVLRKPKSYQLDFIWEQV